jgi:4-hydroxy-3-methylbut-2-enyl diphosphate reductase
MKILIAKTSGFCMGVRRAVEMVFDAPGKNPPPVCTYGPLIHNPQVLQLMRDKGIQTLEGVPAKGDGTVLIRAHGVPPETRKALKAVGFKVIDATCPRVVKVQSIIRRHAKQNFTTIIVGDRDHPEIKALMGFTEGRGHPVATMEEIEKLPVFERAIIVAQTTQNTRFFEQVKQWAAEKHPHYKIFNTICDSTERRQEEVKRLAESVDAVIVVGGLNSGNTRRLCEIARQSGKPAFHIETEADLGKAEFQQMSTARRVGITAGASTPNWIIKRVYRRLEARLFNRKQGWRSLAYPLMRTLLLTNLYVSLGAGCLCYACTRLQGLDRYYLYGLISFLYVQSMHILNHLTGGNADQYNDPERAEFYLTHRVALTSLALGAGGAGLMIAYTLGTLPFVLLLVMSLLGLSYNVQLVPRRFSHLLYRRIRDIPGSKTYLIAMAWGVVTAILPALDEWGRVGRGTTLVFFWATAMVFVRTAFFDILDMQGDRIVGKETLPVLLGEKKSMHLLKFTLIGIAGSMIAAGLLGWVPMLSLILAFCPLFLLAILSTYERGGMLPGIRLEFLVESHFTLAGILTLFWMAAV